MRVPTLGVEEEFLLVDRDSRAPVDRAPQLLPGLREQLGDQVQAEYFTSQVEVCSTPVTSLAALRAQLVRLRAVVGTAAAACGARVVGAGTSPLAGEKPVPVTDSARYRRMAARFGAVATGGDGVVCGCHVHLGTGSRAEALALSARLRPWLPVFQALAANSPYCAGQDTGYASWRSVRWAGWPTVGPAPVLDAEGYERLADALVGSGLLLDRRMIYWYARPSEHVPTLEVRIADSSARVDTTVLVAGLVRGLAARLLADRDEGRPVPPLDEELLRAAHGCAARTGMAGPGLSLPGGRPAPARLLADRLLRYAEPGLAAAGDLAVVTALLDRLRTEGTGAERQRAAYRRRRRLTDVVDRLATDVLDF